MNSRYRGKIEASEHLKSILTERSSPLAQIYQAYQIHQDLKQQLEKDLPEEWRVHAVFLLYRGGILSVGVSSSALQTRLRYEKAAVLTHLRQYKAWAGLKDLKISGLPFDFVDRHEKKS